jgi:hypothetical protein
VPCRSFGTALTRRRTRRCHRRELCRRTHCHERTVPISTPAYAATQRSTLASAERSIDVGLERANLVGAEVDEVIEVRDRRCDTWRPNAHG